MVNKQQNGHS